MKIKTQILLSSIIFLIIIIFNGFFGFFEIRHIMKREITKKIQIASKLSLGIIQSSVNSSIKSYLRSAVDTSRSIVEKAYADFQSGKLSEEEAKERAWKELSQQKIGTRVGDLVIADANSFVMLKHPKASLIGKVSVIKRKTPSNIVSILEKEKYYFFSYEWKKPNGETGLKSMSIIYFKPWNWIIGTKNYRADFLNLVNPDDFKKEILDINFGGLGYVTVIDGKGKIIIHPTLKKGHNVLTLKGKNGKYIFKEILAHKKKSGEYRYKLKIRGTNKVVDKIMYYHYYPNFDWIVVSAIGTEAMSSDINHNLLISSIILLICILLAILVRFYLGNKISKPLMKITNRMQDISEGQGDLTVRLLTGSNDDEISTMASSFNKFSEKLQSIIKNVKNDMNTLNQKSSDLAANSQQSAASIQEITSSLQAVMNNITNQKEMVKNSNNSTQEILNGTKLISEMSDEIQDHISQSSTAIEEMAANIASTAEMAKKADSSTQKLVEISEKGNQSINVLSSSTDEVSENSQKIVEMVQLIMDIAEQTNLLAMNAAIEAAHAGEYGKGFAVVAEEIRKLADKSGKGAKEIQEIVQLISNNVQENLSHTEITKNNFKVLQSNIESVKQVNHEIAFSMDEQKSANQSILEAINKLSQIGKEIGSKTTEEKEKGEEVEDQLSKLSVFTEEISLAMQEQKNALFETASSSEHISSISAYLKELADNLNNDFSAFKTE